MNEEELREFKPAAPPPGLKERILAKARSAPPPSIIDRLWTRQVWIGLAAAFLVSIGLYAYSVSSLRFDPAGAVAEVRRAFEVGRQVIARERDAKAMTIMEARMRGSNALTWDLAR